MAKKQTSLLEAFREFNRCVRLERIREMGQFMPPDELKDEIFLTVDWEDRLKKLLQICGTPGVCKGCKAEIYWLHTRRDAVLPYTKEGLPHFSDCPKASEFRKKKK